MRYEIKGENLPALIVNLDAGEAVNCESGAMIWMTPNMQMQTSGGGIGKMFSKAFSGESMFRNTYIAQGGEGMIAFGSSFPGSIIPVEIGPGKEIICQKTAYLASSSGVESSIFFQKKLGAGFFGGEGFIMQKLSGNGIAFLEIDGSIVEYNLEAGQKMIIDTGYLAYMSGTCAIDVETVKGGAKNMLLGGEGLFNTVVTGPGKIGLQTMPKNQFVSVITPYLPTKNN